MEIDQFWTRGNLKERINNALNESGLNKENIKANKGNLKEV